MLDRLIDVLLKEEVDLAKEYKDTEEKANEAYKILGGMNKHCFKTAIGFMVIDYCEENGIDAQDMAIEILESLHHSKVPVRKVSEQHE